MNRLTEAAQANALCTMQTWTFGHGYHVMHVTLHPLSDVIVCVL